MVALGADRPGVVWLMLRNGLTLVVTGLIVGVAIALALTRFLESLLFGVGTHDPATFTALAIQLLCIGTSAMIGPATRAARVGPGRVMRDDG